LADMRFGLDPRFQFGVSRAIYKGILRFLAANEGREAIVQPLPPQGMMIERLGGKKIRISWQPTEDALEPSALPESYIVYQRNEGLGFDTGTHTPESFFETELPEWNTLFGFRVSAVNKGGESFPSETLSVALIEDQPKTVLVVSAFTRISGPAIFDGPSMAGLAWWEDQGVPFHFNASYTGHPFDFDRKSSWLHDDSPGWGASHADMEEMILKGNSFDFTAIHGAAIRDAGYSFVSASRKALEENRVTSADYWAVNVIFGEQLGVPELKESTETEFRVFTPELTGWLKDFTESGGHVFASGAYIGTDMIMHNDSLAMHFAKETLGYVWRTNHASNNPDIFVTDEHSGAFPQKLQFNAAYHSDYYVVEAPDGIEPASPAAYTLFRYGVNQISAGVIFQDKHKAVSLGFPFEAITDPRQRLELMKSILNFFEHKE
ncbi:MAG: fibronectin type III domain-containing protein, partial [Bacteroidales bacterium]|nr:fibronectin type III domain-containing protein [Bacteroidales bacterium]